MTNDLTLLGLTGSGRGNGSLQASGPGEPKPKSSLKATQQAAPSQSQEASSDPNLSEIDRIASAVDLAISLEDN